MRPRIPAPRLLPLTIGMLAAVLSVKSFLLLQSAITLGPPAALIAAARAGGHEAPARQVKPQQDAERKPSGHEPAAAKNHRLQTRGFQNRLFQKGRRQSAKAKRPCCWSCASGGGNWKRATPLCPRVNR